LLVSAGIAILAFTPERAAAQDKPAKVKVLIITGSHGHDWKGTLPILEEMYKASGRFEVAVTLDPRKDLTPEKLASHDVFLLHYKETDASPGRWPPAAEEALLGAVRGGKGLVVLHFASAAFDAAGVNWPEYEKLIGGGWRRSKGFGAHAPMYQFRVDIVDKEHPITRGLPASFLHVKDELYHKLMMAEGNHVLAEALDDHEKGTKKKEPLVWVLSYGKGRVYHNALGHSVEPMKGPGFQALMARGTEWAATGKVTLPAPASLDSPPEK
jgi:type 1 glutamine amidotransferase